MGLVLAGCPREAGVPSPVPEVERPTVLLAGCGDVEADGTCVLGPGRASLRLWIDVQEHADVRVTIDGQAAAVTRRGIDGGLRLELEVPEHAGALAVEGADPRWREGWQRALVHRPAPALPPALDDLACADEPRAADLLPGLGERERLAAHQRLQALAFGCGDLASAARHSARARALAQRLGRPRAAARAAATTVFIHAYRWGDPASAEPALAVLDALGTELPEAAVWAAFSHGLVARALGDTTRALASFQDAARLAERLGMHAELLTAREGLGITYGELGRGHDAVALAQRVLEDAELPGVACPLRFSALNTAGWVQLLLQQRRVAHVDPEALLEQALALVEPGGECPSDDDEINVRINLALGALGERDPAMALAWLESVDVVPEAYRSWVEEVRARAGLALGRWELVPLPLVGPDPARPRAERWNALMRQAAVLEALGLPGAALDAYTQADAVVEESVSAIGVDLGRELFLSGMQASAQGLVRGLVRAGRHADALCQARLARGRALRRLDRAARLVGASPQARAAWEADVAAVAELRRALDAEATTDWSLSAAEQSRRRARRAERQALARRRLDAAYSRLGALSAVDGCEALPALGEGEVMLVLFPLETGSIALLADATTVTALEVSDAPEGAGLGPWAQALLAGSAAMIERARALRILPTGRTWDVAFHALPWGEGVLLDAAPVSYALDLVQPAGPPLEPGRALVVADPRMDLPQAGHEADRIAAVLARGTWQVERLTGSDASRERVQASLAGATLLHYAGHGEHGGETGWDARLLLLEGEGIGVTDVLALPRVPRAVVLSGCETGRVTSDTLEGGMSIGRAFALAGSEWVIAVDRRVGDDLSSAMGRALYEELAAVGWDGPRALARAQQRLRAADPHADWAAFRAIVR